MKPYEQTYQILSVLGEGGMGRVYLVRHLRLGTLWAMKQVNKRNGERIDLLGEANILKNLRHPALPRIIDIFEDDESLYIVEDYIEGVSLDRQLAAAGRFPEVQVRSWALQLCDVLSYLHNQRPNPIIYRDMKPSNVIVTADGSVKLVDFGIAHVYSYSVNSNFTSVGTRGYAAPEQYSSVRQPDARTDIYSLGATLHHLLSGKSPNVPPYGFAPLRKLCPEISEGMEYVVTKCTRENPKDRYASAAEMAADIRRIETFSSAYKKQKSIRTLKTVACIALIAVGAAMTFTGFAVSRGEAEVAYEKQCEKGVTLIKEGNLSEAEEVLEAADESMKGKSDGRVAILTGYINNGLSEQALDYVKSALAADASLSKRAEFNYCWGVALLDTGDAETAVEKLASAEQQEPDNKVFIRALARAYAADGNMASAKVELSKIEKLGDDAATALVYAGILQAQGDTDQAAEKYSEAISKAEDDELKLSAYRAFVDMYRKGSEKDPNCLKKEIETLLAMQQAYPDQQQAYIQDSLGAAYYAIGLQDSDNTSLNKAADCFEQVVKLGYARASTYLNIAIVRQQLKQYDDAEAALKEMLDVYPNNADADLQMAFLIAERENSKSQTARDYSGVKKYHDLAVQNGASGEKLQRLEGILSDLQSGGWLN